MMKTEYLYLFAIEMNHFYVYIQECYIKLLLISSQCITQKELQYD